MVHTINDSYKHQRAAQPQPPAPPLAGASWQLPVLQCSCDTSKGAQLAVVAPTSLSTALYRNWYLTGWACKHAAWLHSSCTHCRRAWLAAWQLGTPWHTGEAVPWRRATVYEQCTAWSPRVARVAARAAARVAASLEACGSLWMCGSRWKPVEALPSAGSERLPAVAAPPWTRRCEGDGVKATV